MAEIANHVTQEPWPSLDWAAWWFDRAGYLLIASLAVGLLATGLIVWMGIVKEHHWDLLRERANRQIAELGLEAAKANEAAGNANARAAEAQLELARLQTPRGSLTKEQTDAIEKVIKKYPGNVVQIWVFPLNAFDAESLALLLQAIFLETRSDSIAEIWKSMDMGMPGVEIDGREGTSAVDLARELSEVLYSVGIIGPFGGRFAAEYKPKIWGSVVQAPPNPTTKEITMVIRIGAKR